MSDGYKELKNLSEKELTKILYDSYKMMRQNWEFVSQIGYFLEQNPHVQADRKWISIFGEISLTSTMMVPWYRIYQVLREMKIINKNPPFKIWENLNLYYEFLRHPAHEPYKLNNCNFDELFIMDCWFLFDVVPQLKYWTNFCSKDEMLVLTNVENRTYKLYKEWKSKQK